MQTSNLHTQNNNFVQTQLNPLPLRGFFAALGGIILVAAVTFFRLTAVSLSGRHTPCATPQITTGQKQSSCPVHPICSI